jgi:hypothetical protein
MSLPMNIASGCNPGLASRSIATRYYVNNAYNGATPIQAIVDWVNAYDITSIAWGSSVMCTNWTGSAFSTVTAQPGTSYWHSVMCNGTSLGDNSPDYVRTEISFPWSNLCSYTGYMCMGSEWQNGVRGGPCTVGCNSNPANPCPIIELPLTYGTNSYALLFGLTGPLNVSVTPNVAPDLLTWLNNGYHGYPCNGFVISTTPIGWTNPPGWTWNPSQVCDASSTDPFGGDP